MRTQVWRAAIMAVLTIAVATGTVRIWHLFVVAFLITVGEILVDPSVVATVPNIVEPADLDRANSRITTVETLSNDFAGGPLGALSFAFAPWLPFLVDGFTYLFSIAPFSRLPLTAPAEPPATKPAIRDELSAGLRWIKDHPFLRPVTGGIAVFHLGTGGALSLLVLLVVDTLGASKFMFGVALAAAAIGAATTAFTVARLIDRFSRRTVITCAAVVAAFTVAAAGLAQASWQLVLIWIVNGASTGMLHAVGRGFVQRHTPNDRIGRTAIASRMITRSSFVLGALLAGAVATSSSVRVAFVVAGAFHLCGAALLWRSFAAEPESIR